MRTFDCTHRVHDHHRPRRVAATACALTPRRGLERVVPLPDRVLARLAAGDMEARADVLVACWAASAGVVLAALVGLVTAGLLGAVAMASLVVVAGGALLGAGRRSLARFVVFSAHVEAPADAGAGRVADDPSDTRSPARRRPSDDERLEDAIAACEARAVATVAEVVAIPLDGHADWRRQRTVHHAVLSTRARLDQAREAAADARRHEQIAVELDRGTHEPVAAEDVRRVARLAADAVASCRGHLEVLHDCLDALDELAAGARALDRARRLEAARQVIAAPGHRPMPVPTAAEAAVVEDGRAVAEELACRAEALTQLG